MPPAAEVWSTVRHDLAKFAQHVHPPTALLRKNSLLIVTGGPTADFNMALLEASANDEAVLRDFAARVRRRASARAPDGPCWKPLCSDTSSRATRAST